MRYHEIELLAGHYIARRCSSPPTRLWHQDNSEKRSRSSEAPLGISATMTKCRLFKLFSIHEGKLHVDPVDPVDHVDVRMALVNLRMSQPRIR